MPAIVFKKQEEQYLRWLRNNPSGLVINTRKSIPLDYMPLHRASCSSVSEYKGKRTPGAFTERNYIKICSNNASNLIDWIKKQGGDTFTSTACHCKPDAAQIVENTIADIEQEFVNTVNDAIEHKKGRKTRLKAAPKKPKKYSVSVVLFKRNPDVVAEVLERADGFCELCHKTAPFIRSSNNTAYLEVHHKTLLSKGGADTVENAIALCPNCHRKKHYG